ncbi:MAG: flagellar biosynthesis anti-sigma factor FlgM [Novosphingobium sp.]|nr:flagellar biosynthesis anti-sigma factor FlgM [Novosphingobium sp.]
MSRIEGSSGPGALSAIAPVQLRTNRDSPAGTVRSAPAVVLSGAAAAGEPPVDAERVAVIRKAIENGTYPLVPTRVADAMIAAGMLWRSPE